MGPLFTVGHSTRTLEELLSICAANGVTAIADVRRFPGSRRHPQFGRGALEESLPAQGVAYLWMPALGDAAAVRAARRLRPGGSPASPPTRTTCCTSEFRDGIDQLLASLAVRPTAVMCAEASPYRCHRRLLSDWAELHGIEVVHLLQEKRRERHRVTPFARLAGDDVIYLMDTGWAGQLALPLGP